MDFLAWLKPLEYAVAWILVTAHRGLAWLGMNPESGWTWALSIVLLVVFLRILLIPLFVKQIKASRAMQVAAPELRKVQDKYKGKKDQASREAMTRETMAIYSSHKANPLSSCIPLLVQAPVFFALFRVLNNHSQGDGIGALTKALANSLDQAKIMGAPLSDTFTKASNGNVKIIAAILIVAMVSTTFLTQRQLTFKNMPAAALEGPMAQQQKIMLYALPFIFVFSGPIFPIGVLIYWTTSNLWAMGQQFYVIRRNPTPGSEAEKALIARRERKAAHHPELNDAGSSAEAEAAAAAAAAEEAASRQRAQPKRKNRSRK